MWSAFFFLAMIYFIGRLAKELGGFALERATGFGEPEPFGFGWRLLAGAIAAGAALLHAGTLFDAVVVGVVGMVCAPVVFVGLVVVIIARIVGIGV